MRMKDVIISITGTQSYPHGYDDSIELVTDGKYCYRNDRGESLLTYMESDLTGLEGTKTSFTVGPLGVILQREGSSNSRMVFEEGRKHVFLYETPYGATTMGVDTRKVNNTLSEHGGGMEIDYAIDVDNAVVGRNKFIISIREKNKKLYS